MVVANVGIIVLEITVSAAIEGVSVVGRVVGGARIPVVALADGASVTTGVQSTNVKLEGSVVGIAVLATTAGSDGASVLGRREGRRDGASVGAVVGDVCVVVSWRLLLLGAC